MNEFSFNVASASFLWLRLRLRLVWVVVHSSCRGGCGFRVYVDPFDEVVIVTYDKLYLSWFDTRLGLEALYTCNLGYTRLENRLEST